MTGKTYTWKITDLSLIEKMKNAKVKEAFFSPKFYLYPPFRWELEIYPNGSQEAQQGCVDIYVNLIALSPTINSVKMRRKYTFEEANVFCDRINPKDITSDNMYANSWPKGTLKFADFTKYNQFTFTVEVEILAVFDKDDEDITMKYVPNDDETKSDDHNTIYSRANHDAQSYAWNITDPSMIKQMKAAKNKQVFVSPKFYSYPPLRWYIRLYPNGDRNDHAGKVNFYVHLVALSPNVKAIRVKRRYTFEQRNVSYYAINNSDVTHDAMYLQGWPTTKLSLSDLQKHDQFTFKVEIEILAVFDKHDRDITIKYLTNEEFKTDDDIKGKSGGANLNVAKLDSIATQMEVMNKAIQQLQKNVNDIELRMNEEQKDDQIGNRVDEMEKEMKIMKQNVSKLLLTNMDPEKQKLKSWLEDTIKLPQYFDIFVEAGFEDLNTVSLLDKNALKELGVDKLAHQMKILNGLKQLQPKNEKEGGTAYI